MGTSSTRFQFLRFLALQLIIVSSSFNHVASIRQKSILKMPTSTNDSTVLGELKETIRKQTAEIESLKAQLAKGEKPPAKHAATSHGGHGGTASHQEVANYLDEPFYQMSFKRVGWLGIFLGSLSLTAVIMNSFEHTLERHLELAYFVPMLAGHGGNTGGQAVGTILSALSSGAIKPHDAPRVILKEAMSGIMSGCILSCFLGPIAHYVMGISLHVSAALFFTMPMVSTIAATLGSTIPFVCVLVGLDPSVIAAPAMTSIVDVSGLMGYFVIANYIFKFFGLEL
jgi:cation transporter-like permease